MTSLKSSAGLSVTQTSATSAVSTSTAANLSHKAFDSILLIDKLPLVIESMTCYDNILLLGTACGRILVYEIKINELAPSKFELDLKKSISATKKPIQQLEAVRSFDILIALFDAQLHVFDLDRFQLQYSLNKSKGCSLFTTSISNDQKLLRMCVACKKKLQFYYLNIQSKSTSQFMELISDLDLSDTPRSLKFTKENLVVLAFRKDYYYYEIPASSVALSKQPEIKFSTGSRQSEPLCEKLHNDYFALGVDENKTIIYDTRGKPCLEYPILWANTPSTVCSVGPYLISILPALNCVEICTYQSGCMSVQLMEFHTTTTTKSAEQTESKSFSSSFSSSFLGQAMTAPVYAVTNTVSSLTSLASGGSSNINPADKLKLLKSNSNSVCYVATQSYLWCLIPIKVNDQLEQVLRYKNYELGLNLISTQAGFNAPESVFSQPWPPITKDLDAKLTSNILAPFFTMKPLEADLAESTQRRIQNLNALDLFYKKKFAESLQMFQKMRTDPSHIMALLPGLLPDSFRSKLKLDEYYPVLDARELEEAIDSLIDYLQFKRNEFLKEEQQKMSPKESKSPTELSLIPLIEGKTVLKTRMSLLQIIDTTLLKCYLKTKENLVPFFLRREQNYLHFDESERLLLQHNKINELTILYEKKEAHEKALSLLMSESTRTSSSLYGLKHIVEYLKKIGNKNLELIFKYAKSVIESDPKWGVKIFMGNTAKIDEILVKRAKLKEENLVKKRKSLSSIKSVIGGGSNDLNGNSVLSALLKINKTNFDNNDNDDDDSKVKNNKKVASDLDMLEDDDDDERLKALDHVQVCKFLREQIEPESLSIHLVRNYLQYCIFVWNDKTADLNNQLIDTYIYFIEKKIDDSPSSVGQSTQTYKQMLIYFLTETKYYEPNYASAKLGFDNYPEERAIVLGKLNKHKEALKIYVDILNDTDKAEAYCEHVYTSSSTPEAKEVYYQLLEIYLKSEYEEIRIGASSRLLNAHSNEIGSCKSLELLPADLFKCKNLSPFFENMLNRLARNKHTTQIINRLMFSLELQIHETKILCQDKKFIVNDEQMCKECNKRMGKSAMVRFPNGDLIHYGCSKNSEAYIKRNNH